MKKRPVIPPAFNEDDGFGLEHVLTMLRQEAEAADIELRAPNGIPYFRELQPRLDAQWQEHKRLIESEEFAPGYRAAVERDYAKTSELLINIGTNRAKLAAYIEDLKRSLRELHEYYLRDQASFAQRLEGRLNKVVEEQEKAKVETSRLQSIRASNPRKEISKEEIIAFREDFERTNGTLRGWKKAACIQFSTTIKTLNKKAE